MEINTRVLLSLILASCCPHLAAIAAPLQLEQKPAGNMYEAVATCPTNTPANLDGYAALDPQSLLDLPDSEIVRATSTFEAGFVDKMVRGEIHGLLIKSYCQIGITRMVVDLTHAVEDDAISHISQRAIYKWVAHSEPIGWQISELGEKLICARATHSASGQCL